MTYPTGGVFPDVSGEGNWRGALAAAGKLARHICRSRQTGASHLPRASCSLAEVGPGAVRRGLRCTLHPGQEERYTAAILPDGVGMWKRRTPGCRRETRSGGPFDWRAVALSSSANCGSEPGYCWPRGENCDFVQRHVQCSISYGDFCSGGKSGGKYAIFGRCGAVRG